MACDRAEGPARRVSGGFEAVYRGVVSHPVPETGSHLPFTAPSISPAIVFTTTPLANGPPGGDCVIVGCVVSGDEFGQERRAPAPLPLYGVEGWPGQRRIGSYSGIQAALEACFAEQQERQILALRLPPNEFPDGIPL
jgi:hypothetical protein